MHKIIILRNVITYYFLVIPYKMATFYWKVYRELNKDLIAVNLNTEKQIMDHWYKYGQYENRITKVTDITPEFDWQIYLLLNSDLKNAGIIDQIDAEIHWINYGQYENRFTKITDVTPGFFWRHYLKANPGLIKNGIDNKVKAELHWLEHGIREKRIYRKTKYNSQLNDTIKKKENNNNKQPFIIKYYNDHMKSYINQSVHEELTNLIGTNDQKFVGKANLAEYFLVHYGKIPDGIMFLWSFWKEICDLIRIQLPNTKIILWTVDLHWYTDDQYENNYYSYLATDLILTRYNYYKMFYDIDVDAKLISLKQSCCNLFFKNTINYESLNKIYIYGSMEKMHYKLRNWFANKMNKEYPDKVVIRPHPGYEIDNIKNAQDTAKELYKYSFSFTASCIPNFEIKEEKDTPYYLLCKFFEIPGSGALLLCNDHGVRKQLNEVGFYNMENYVHIDDSNFNEIINWLFNPQNKEKIIDIREKGNKLVKDKHTTIQRVTIANEEMAKYC